jgi:hypothetical protein
MFRLAIVVLAALVMSAPAVADDDKDVMATVNRFVDGFNKGDTGAAAAACADETSILDEFPPHEWHGSGACLRWMSDYDVDAKRNGIADGVVTLGTEASRRHRRPCLRGDSLELHVQDEGKPVKETGSMFTFALRRGESGWRITGWSWGQELARAKTHAERRQGRRSRARLAEAPGHQVRAGRMARYALPRTTRSGSRSATFSNWRNGWEEPRARRRPLEDGLARGADARGLRR